jgi:sugar O-acyltransferase (sialic acid O-acetyltransferase NeuD family)
MSRAVVVVGGGGHAKVVLDLLYVLGEDVEGFTDAGGIGDLLDSPRLGSDDDLATLRERGLCRAVIAIGDNARRERLLLRTAELGFELPAFVHPRATVSRFARLGQGVVAMAGAVVNASTVIGAGTILNTACSVDHDCHLGACVHIAPGSRLAGYVTIGDRALVGVGSSIGRGKPLCIGADVRIGTGSVVIADLADEVTVAGNPARPLRAPAARPGA